MKFCPKRPYLSFLWSFPLILVLAHDLFVWLNASSDFHFSETGYLLQHYTPFEDAVVHASPSALYRDVLSLILNAKAVLVTGIPAALALLWINRSPRRQVLKHRYR